MKKKHILLILVVLLTLSMTTAAFAKQSGETVTGYIDPSTDFEICETLIIETEDGEFENITLPDLFDCDSFVGYPYVKVTGDWSINEDGDAELVLISFEPVEPDGEEGKEGEVEEGEGEEGEEGEGEGWGKGGVYCSEDSGRTHPIALKIAEKFGDKGIDTKWVNIQICDGGFGFGEVMLAIQTQLAVQKKNGQEECTEETCGEGVGSTFGMDAEKWLNHRRAGQGWGQIWKGIDIVENDNTDSPGNGKFNKPEKEKGPKEGKGPDKGPEHPSNKVKPNKENKNNKNKNDEDD